MNVLDLLSKSPVCFHYLKKAVELNYGNTKNKISRFYNNGDLVLDIGCGTGEFSTEFHPSCYKGIDIYDKYIEFARDTFPEYDFSCEDATKLSLPDNTFEFAFIHGVLHHLDDDQATEVLREAHRALKPQGKVLLIEDIPARPGNLLGHLMHWADRGGWIRTKSAYQELFSELYKLESTEVYVSGICDYALFFLTCKSSKTCNSLNTTT